jgi:putative hemolysin
LGSGGFATGRGFTTLAGLVLQPLQRIPHVGQVLVVNGWRLEIVDLDGNRIDKVIVSRLRGPASRV